MPPRPAPSHHHHHDPFTDAPLRPTTTNSTNPALRSQASQQSLRSNTSTAASTSTSRTRAQASSLFAQHPPALSRRPTPRVVDQHDGILADSDSDDGEAVVGSVSRPAAVRRGGGAAARRGGSPEGKGGRGKGRDAGGGEEVEIVNRRADGGYLLGVRGVGEAVAVPVVAVPKTEEEVEQEEVDAHYRDISRQYFASGSALGGRSGKKHEEELEQLRLPMMLRLREQVTEKLEGERWQFESVERYQPTM